MKITDVAAAVIERPDGSFLLGQRAPGTFYAGFWEFPGGKVEAGETALQALVRELREELDITVLRADPWLLRHHAYEHAHVRLSFFRVREWQGEVRDIVHSALAWQMPNVLSVSPMLPANAPVLSALALPDFYAITYAAEIGVERQLLQLERALQSGLRLVQLREPGLSPAARDAFVRAAVQLCHQFGAKVLVHADAQLARDAGADGVHLRASQVTQLQQRPDFALVAASCHDQGELLAAAALGADFAVLGPVKKTLTHPEAPCLDWTGFAAAVAVPPLPTFALGGLSRADIDRAHQFGAHGVAAIRAAWE